MSKARVAVLKVVTNELTLTEAAERYGFSRPHLHRLLARYREDDIQAVEPRSRRPHHPGNATSTELQRLIIELRLKLTSAGRDAADLRQALLAQHTKNPRPMAGGLP